MECCVAVRKTRLVFQLVSFGAILVWIVFGTYRHSPTDWVTSKRGDLLVEETGGFGGMRHLLSSEDDDDECLSELLYKNGTVINKDEAECSEIHSLSQNFSTCVFIKCVASCQIEEGLMSYLDFVYCKIPSKLIPLAMVVLFLWLLFLFIFLGATAEEYFCPALTVISAILRLSQNVAGVTLLALGNGAPDIFSAFAAVSQAEDRKASLAVGALFGAGIFVTTVVVGLVTITKPFTLTQRPFLRDIIFYIFAVFWTFYLLWTHYMTIYNAVGFISLYVFYVIVVILGRVIFQRWKKWRKRHTVGTGDMPRPPTPPEGKEMDDSSTMEPSSRSGLAALGSLMPGMGLASQNPPPPVANGFVSTRHGGGKYGNEEEDEEEEELDTTKLEKDPRAIFRISDIGGSDSSGTHSERPVIRIQKEDGTTEEGSPLSSTKQSMEERRRQKELDGASMPPLETPKSLLAARGSRTRGSSARGGGEEGGAKGGYGTFGVTIQSDNDRSRSPSPVRKPLRKTISGALDVTEGIGAAFGIPHVPELWEEVSRSHGHSHSRSRTSSRARSQSRSVLTEVSEAESSRTPLLGPSVSTNVSSRDQESDSEQEDEDQDEDGDMNPIIKLSTRRRKHPLLKFLLALWPFGESFRELGALGKIYEILKSPAGLMLTLTVPVIDTNEDDHNWNKYLSVLHTAIAPAFISLITKRGLYLIGGVFPIWTLLLIVGIMLAIVVACTSKPDKPPIYHCVFAWLGFAVAVVWIYSIANEIVNLLQAFGVVIKLSDGILGLTLLAWGNSIGDAVSNVTMSRQGFPRMAIGACFGGPLLNMLLGIGIASVFKCIKRKADGFKFRLYFTQVEFVAAVFLMFGLACTLVTVSLFKFRLKRPYGLFLVAFYIVFLTIAILAEVPVFPIPITGVIDH